MKNPDPYEQSPEIYYTNITANLLESSAEFRETARKAGLLRQFIDLFRRRWENVWCHWQGRNIVFLVLSIQQAALTFQAHVEHSMQDLKDLVVDVAEWASDFLLFLDQSWDKVVEEPALDQFRRSSLLEILLDSYVRLLSTLMRHGLKALPGIKRRSRELSKIFTTKILRYFDTARFTQRHVHLVSKQREVFEDAAEYFQRETENDDMCRTPKATENADSSLLSEIFMKLQNSGAGKAGCLLNLAAKQLDKCTAEQAESLISEGAASITLRALVGLSVPEVNSKAGAETVTLSERSAITGRALQVLKKLILKVEKSRKPALQGSFFEICVGLLEWTSAVKLLDRSAGFVALDEKLETDVYNAVLCFLMETELWDLRELSERLQMQYVDLAVSAIKLNPFSETASIAWATLSSLKGAAYENRSSRVTIANEYLWHPGSEPVKLASDSQQLRNCCMYNIGKIYHERGLMALSLKELRHVQQSRFRLFGLPRYVLSVLQVCCFAAPIERALLPDFESVIQTLDLVRNTMLAAFGPFGPFDGPPPKRFDSMTGEDILNEALFNLFEIFGAFLGALDDPATHPKLRRQVLLRIVRGNGPALCAKVLRDFCTFQAALPDKAAEQERIPPVQRRVKRLWEVQALEFGLRACSNPVSFHSERAIVFVF